MRRFFLPLIAVASILSCTGEAPTEPTPDPLTLTYAPVIREIYLDGSWQPGGTLAFVANADDVDFRMPPASFFLMNVSTNHGDAEIVRAQNMLCFDADARPYTCHQLLVVLDAEANLTSVQTAASNADARLHWGGFLPDSAIFFAFGNTDAALAALRRHSSVAEAMPLFISDTTSAALDWFQHFAQATLRLHEGTPKLNDGRLTVNGGDSLFVSVLQPGGYVTWRFGPLPR